eukprot:s2949_g7.t2
MAEISEEVDYLAVLNTTIGGYISSLCRWLSWGSASARGSWAYSSEIALIEEFEHSRQAPYLCCIHLHSFVSTNNILTI